MTLRARRFRRTVSFDDDVVNGLFQYRASFLKRGEEKTFGPSVNELLREILTQKNIIQSGETPT